MTTDVTIHEVSLRLFARCMMYGNPNKDNNYISSEHFRQLNTTVPADVKALINHNSEQATYANLKAYEKPMNYTTAKSLMDYLERQLGDRAKIIRANRDFTDQITDISRIQSRISNLRLMTSEGGEGNVESQLELAKAEKMLQDRTARMKELTRDIEAGSYSTETGVKANDMISRWLEQVLLLEKTKAEMSAQDIMRQKLDQADSILCSYWCDIGS